MAAAAAPQAALRAQFEAALGEHNYGRRCHLLSVLGKEIKSSAPAAEGLAAVLDGLAEDAAGGPAFVELSRLIVAKAAGCMGYSQRFLDHPSQAVRFAAVRGGILRPAEAREAFLSSSSSRKLKKLLVGCQALPVDADVLDHALELFGAHDKERVWALLTRAEDEELVRRWLEDGQPMNEWITEKNMMPVGFPQLAQRHPTVLVDLVREGAMRWGWYWMKDVLQTHPMLVLRTVFIEGSSSGSGPQKGYCPGNPRQNLSKTLASWAWRHEPEMVLDICKELIPQGSRKVSAMLSSLMEVSSTRYYLTTNQKIEYLVRVWSLIPASDRNANWAQTFAEQLPKLKAGRTAELKNLVAAFWRLVEDLDLATRVEMLVGKEPEKACTPFLKQLCDKLPPPLAVEQFFRILAEVEAGRPAYEYMQGTVCKSGDGAHDELMQRVFARYLQKEDQTAEEVAKMFQNLKATARSRDVIQSCFDLLTRRLGNQMELSLLWSTVARMQALEAAAQSDVPEQRPPPATLAVPVAWVRFVELPETAKPHERFLLRVLHSGTGPGELLGAMLAEYGSAFFWDALGHVLDAKRGSAGSKPALPLAQGPALDVLALSKIDLSGLAKPLPKGQAAPAEEEESKYFASVVEAKKKVHAKDPSARETGYTELMRLAKTDKDPSKAFDDLLPFLINRFNAEQEGSRSQMLSDLLGQEFLPFRLWEPKLPHLRSLWRACSKARESAGYSQRWQKVGEKLVTEALRTWRDGAEPSEACLFGQEVAPGLQLPKMVLNLREAISDTAARWVLETTVPLASDTGIPASAFWSTLETLSNIVPPREGGRRALWERWPFVAAHWRAILAQGVRQKAVEFVFVDVVELLASSQKSFRKKGEADTTTWWAPLQCPEYAVAVDGILAQMESGEIPAREASCLLSRRTAALVRREMLTHNDWKVRGRKRRERVPVTTMPEVGQSPKAQEGWTARPPCRLPAQKWVQDESWDFAKHHRYTPLPWETYRCRDSAAAAELRTMSKLLAGGKASRQVQWRIVEMAAMLSGPIATQLVSDAIAGLDPRLEGMARSVTRHYPYLNSAFARGESQSGSPDVLTPLVELWLFDDPTRDECVGKLMERADFEYFLFFGVSFARHLSGMRQEWLHRCVQKLQGHGEADGDDGAAEFYHYTRRGPVLQHVAQLGSGKPGWRRTLQESKDSQGSGSVQVYLWHPATQAEFLQKALRSTDKGTLALTPHFAFAEGVSRMSQLLGSYPKEQSVKEADADPWGWEVIQAAGAYSDLGAEVERRFRELPPPWLRDVVDDPEVEVLLKELARADDGGSALKVLGQYAGKVKQAKEAMTTLISGLSPLRARALLKEVMLPMKAGVGLQVAGLKKIVELQIPDPLELYHFAWRGGRCRRDVAGTILANVATSHDFLPEQVRSFFDFFGQADRQEDCEYVADMLLEQLKDSAEWSMPFLPGVVAKLAMLPGTTKKALEALKVCTTHVAEVLAALAEVVKAARLAARASTSARPKKDGPEAQVLADLSGLSSPASLRSIMTAVKQLALDECEPTVLQAFVKEMLQQWSHRDLAETEAASLLDCILAVWVNLLRPGHVEAWPAVLSEMDAHLARWGRAKDLGAMAKAVTGHVQGMVVDSQACRQIHATLRGFFERLLDVQLAFRPELPKSADAAFKEGEQERTTVANTLVVAHWAKLLARGCSEQESAALFARCPEALRVRLAETVVDAAVKAEKKSVEAARSAQWQQRRPEEGWAHTGGVPIDQLVVGSEVSGSVTNSSANCGVFVDFGCVKDGRLKLPTNDWKKYRVGDRVEHMIINKVEKGKFIDLILMGSPGFGSGAVGSEDGCSAKDMAGRTLKWLATPPEMREAHFGTLVKLWASVAALEREASAFAGSLALLGSPPPSAQGCASLVEALLKEEPQAGLAREALQWLGERCPEDAVRLWPRSLNLEEDKGAGGDADGYASGILALIAFCETRGLEPPEVPRIGLRELPAEALAKLEASSLAEARLLVVLALEERRCKLEDPACQALDRLCGDASEVVRAAARGLWVSLGGKRDTKAKEDVEEA